jgi:hypothetical protein
MFFLMGNSLSQNYTDFCILIILNESLFKDGLQSLKHIQCL